jgi:signal transduction histidine kinase
VGSGELSARVPTGRRDEFGQLAAEFNRMCERLEQAQQALVAEHEERRLVESRLRTTEHLASLGRLAAGLAHEIGTPLNVIGGRAEALQRKLAGHDPADRHLRIITAQIDRITRVVRGVLDFARGRDPHFATTRVPGVIRKVLEFLEHRLIESRVEVDLVVDDDLPPIVADADQLQQVVLNLAMNAIDAMPDGGLLTIRCRSIAENASGTGEAGAVQMEFEDTGRGIAPENLERVLEPFFTTKEIGKGTGLGLSVCYQIVRSHGGSLRVESEPDRGSRFVVRLPVRREAAVA